MDKEKSGGNEDQHLILPPIFASFHRPVSLCQVTFTLKLFNVSSDYITTVSPELYLEVDEKSGLWQSSRMLTRRAGEGVEYRLAFFLNDYGMTTTRFGLLGFISSKRRTNDDDHDNDGGRFAMRTMEISNLTILEKMDFHVSGHPLARFIPGAEQRLTSAHLAAALRRRVPEFRPFEAAFSGHHDSVHAGGPSRRGNFSFLDYRFSFIGEEIDLAAGVTPMVSFLGHDKNYFYRSEAYPAHALGFIAAGSMFTMRVEFPTDARIR